MEFISKDLLVLAMTQRTSEDIEDNKDIEENINENIQNMEI